MHEGEDMNDVMNLVLQHYLKHHELVLKKLKLAQKATQLSMEELQDQFEKNPASIDTIWSEIIEVFADCGLSESDLFSIEGVLKKIPKPVQSKYQNLVEADHSIQDLMNSIDSEDYKRAFQVIDHLQAEPNPISGLTADDYRNELTGSSRQKNIITGDKEEKDDASSKPWWDEGNTKK